MNFKKIVNLENTIKTGGRSRYTLQNFSFPIPGDDDKLEGLVCRPAKGYTSYYYDDVVKKEKIAIHYTAGNLQGDLGALSKNDYHVSVPFVIARDGTIYQLHSSRHWSYHLGRGALGGNKIQSQKAIGIEISNYGFLVPKGDNLETYYSRRKRDNGRENPVDVYCTKADMDKYVHLDEPFRGHSYWASFTDVQYESLIKLLRYLTSTYDIPRAFMDEADRYVTTKKVINFKGIVSHVNYRKDKWDIGKPFDWDRVINGVKGTEDPQNEFDSAKRAFDKAVEIAQAAQLKVWAKNPTDIAGAEAELAAAEKNLLATHAKLEAIKKKLSDNNILIASRSLTEVYNSEKQVEEAFPFIRSRSLLDHGEDGPEEIIYDPFDYQ